MTTITSARPDDTPFPSLSGTKASVADLCESARSDCTKSSEGCRWSQVIRVTAARRGARPHSDGRQALGWLPGTRMGIGWAAAGMSIRLSAETIDA